MARGIFQRLAGRPLPRVPDPAIRLVQAKSGRPTLQREGRYLHSRYDPEQEAARVLETGEPAAAAVLFGCGLGYLAARWCALHPDLPLLIIESDPRLLAMADRHGPSLPEQAPLFLSLSATRDELLPFFQALAPEALRHIRLLETRGVVDAEPRYYAAARERFLDCLREYMGNLFTELEFERLWFRNILCNWPQALQQGRFLQLHNRFPDHSVLLVGAGPSLAGLLPLLRRLQRVAVLAAVDTALATLLHSGLVPDMVVSLDGQIHNYHDFLGQSLEQTVLLCDIRVYPAIPRLPFRSIYFFESGEFSSSEGQTRFHSHPAVMTLKQCCGELGPVRSGGNVATSALELLSIMGFRRIFLAGCDNGFPGMVFHSRGTPGHQRNLLRCTRIDSLEKLEQQSLRRRALVRGQDYLGQPLTSDVVLKKYAAWAVALRAELGKNVEWYNLSPQSLVQEGIPLLPQAEAEAISETTPLVRPLPFPEPQTEEGHDGCLADKVRSLHQALKQAMQHLEQEREPASNAAALISFFQTHPMLRRAYGAQLLQARRRGLDTAEGQSYLLREIRFQLRRTERYLQRTLRCL